VHRWSDAEPLNRNTTIYANTKEQYFHRAHTQAKVELRYFKSSLQSFGRSKSNGRAYLRSWEKETICSPEIYVSCCESCDETTTLERAAKMLFLSLYGSNNEWSRKIHYDKGWQCCQRDGRYAIYETQSCWVSLVFRLLRLLTISRGFNALPQR
jgi:hypothetical protein